MDNCGTFDRLIPLLNKNIGYLAVDLPGHGYSSHIPAGMFYHQTLYYLLINHIIEYFHWRSVPLLGHSLGAMVAFPYTMLFSNKVDFLICLDGMKPIIGPKEGRNSLKHVMKFLKYEAQQRSTKEPPSYSLETIKEKISQAQNNSIDIKFSHFIASRNIKPSKHFPNQYYFTRDPRMKVLPVLHWEQDELLKYVTNMKLPILIVEALGGFYKSPKNLFDGVMNTMKKFNKDFYFLELEGTHHLHLNNPEELSEVINTFLDDYHKEEAS